jgi:hypothetical protein
MSSINSKIGPGFQSSERSDVAAVIYRKNSDRILLARSIDQSGAFTLGGTQENAAIVSAQMQKSHGQGWQWSFQLKLPPGVELLEQIQDDDWIDIFLSRWGYVWHVIRGSIDECRRRRNVGGTGATITTYSITGRCFQKIYEITPIWFNRYNADNVAGSIAYSLVNAPNIGGDVADTVRLFLQGFLKNTSDLGRSNWKFPAGMPNTNGAFTDVVQFSSSGYKDIPARQSVSASLMMPEGTVWDLANQWRDQNFCELYTDLIPKAFNSVNGTEIDISDPTVFAQNAASTDHGLDTSQTIMTTVLRDKPFVMVDPAIQAAYDEANGEHTPITGLDSPWFKLPLYKVPRQYIVADDIGWSGYERLNMFLASSPALQQFMKGDFMSLTQPLWATGDMLEHGMRQMDVVTNYVAKNADLFSMSIVQRLMARDWYCMNPYFLNGTLSFAVGLPDLHNGTRLRILGNTPDDDETYYVEGVAHNYSMPGGTKTTATVTRGVKGTDSNYVQTLKAIVQQYEAATAGIAPGDET